MAVVAVEKCLEQTHFSDFPAFSMELRRLRKIVRDERFIKCHCQLRNVVTNMSESEPSTSEPQVDASHHEDPPCQASALDDSPAEMATPSRVINMPSSSDQPENPHSNPQSAEPSEPENSSFPDSSSDPLPDDDEAQYHKQISDAPSLKPDVIGSDEPPIEPAAEDPNDSDSAAISANQLESAMNDLSIDVDPNLSLAADGAIDAAADIASSLLSPSLPSSQPISMAPFISSSSPAPAPMATNQKPSKVKPSRPAHNPLSPSDSISPTSNNKFRASRKNGGAESPGTGGDEPLSPTASSLTGMTEEEEVARHAQMAADRVAQRKREEVLRRKAQERARADAIRQQLAEKERERARLEEEIARVRAEADEDRRRAHQQRDEEKRARDSIAREASYMSAVRLHSKIGQLLLL